MSGWTGSSVLEKEMVSNFDYSDLITEFAAQKLRKVDFI
jgi:hypothetical protein